MCGVLSRFFLTALGSVLTRWKSFSSDCGVPCGVYLRRNPWWLDCLINGTRYQLPLGKGISRSVASELAQVKRAAIPRGEVGKGRNKEDLMFEKAAELVLK